MSDESTRTPVLLDCDPGIDDVLALAHLLARPALRLVGIGTVSGNVDAAAAARNTLRVLDLLGAPDVPVAVGGRDFLTRPFHGGAPQVHGANGIGEVDLPESQRVLVGGTAAELLVESARRNPGRLRVLAIGPLTNLALALQQEPRLPELVRDVVIMGGAFLEPGNVTPHAEANIHADPEAAAAVFAAPWRIDVVPVDLARQHRLEQADLDALRSDESEVVRTLGAMLDVYGDFYRGVFGRRLAVLYDPLAAALLAGDLRVTRDLAGTVRVVVGDREERGRTTLDEAGEAPRHRVVLATAEPFAPVLDAAIRSLPLRRDPQR